MRKLALFISLLMFTGFLYAQAPNAFKYQAIARDAQGNLVVNQNVGIQIKILQDSIYGANPYTETFIRQTNAFGLIDLAIGEGNVVNGDFSAIDWSQGPYFITIGMDINGGFNSSAMGGSQLLSVPYAL